MAITEPPNTMAFVSSATVLVVDDEADHRKILTAALESEGYGVLQADNGKEALRLIEDSQVDLVVLDVMMPGLDGFETCRRIRDEMGNFTLPVIFTTSREDRESRVRGKSVGGDDFLTKPVDPIELSARVRNLLRVTAYHLRAKQRELLKAELERTREQLLRADRLATLGTLASAVGHELSNILSVLQMSVGLIRQRASRDQPAREKDLEKLDAVARHVETHARHLLSFGRPGPEYAEKIDLRKTVLQTIELLRTAGKLKTVLVETALPPRPVTIEVNRARIEQVIVNLVGNAADALSAAEGREKRVRVVVVIAGKQRVEFRVEDNGCGIPEDQVKSVFEPYFTTKPPGKGTGLGLPVVKNIVESYGGKIDVTSQDGKGTTVRFDLPLERPTE